MNVPVLGIAHFHHGKEDALCRRLLYLRGDLVEDRGRACVVVRREADLGTGEPAEVNFFVLVEKSVVRKGSAFPTCQALLKTSE